MAALSSAMQQKIRQWFREASESPRDRRDGEPRIIARREMGGKKRLVRINRYDNLDGTYRGYVEVSVDEERRQIEFYGKGR